MNTPVVLFTFNRPVMTRDLISRLAELEPKHVLVVSDGPRSFVPTDSSKVAEVRTMFERLPWRCRIDRCYSDVNMGSAGRISSGLNWVFEQVEEAIILEDDCRPGVSFVPYAEELLQRYRYDTRVATICGTTPGFEPSGFHSYRFSRYCFVWGWATWRRAWNMYDHSMDGLNDKTYSEVMKRAGFSFRGRHYWQFVLRKVLRGDLDAWDYRLNFACWKNNMVNIVPRVNLVENVGFGPNATNTSYDIYGLKPMSTIDFPLIHPPEVIADVDGDRSVEDSMYSRTMVNRLRWAVRRAKHALLRS